MSEVRLPAPVQAVSDRTLEEGNFRQRGPAGGFFLEAKPDGDERSIWGWIRFRCPCGCNSYNRLPIGLNEKPPKGADTNAGVRATWMWDGNREKPTLSPSIHHVGHWHGFLRGGFFVQA